MGVQISKDLHLEEGIFSSKMERNSWNGILNDCVKILLVFFRSIVTSMVLKLSFIMVHEFL